MLSLGRTLLALLLAYAVFRLFPHPMNATFPCVELGRGRPPEWEPAWWAALLAVVGITLRRPFARTPVGYLERIIGTLCCAALVAWVFAPVKANIDTLSAAKEGLSAMPVLGGGEAIWSRATVGGNAVTLAWAEMVKEAALMALAGGIHEASSGGSVARTALWGVMRAAANTALIGRIVAVGLVGWVSLALWSPWSEPRRVRQGVDRAVLVLAWILPAANLLALAVATMTGLPDDADLRLRFAQTWLALGAAVGAAHLLGSRGLPSAKEA